MSSFIIPLAYSQMDTDLSGFISRAQTLLRALGIEVAFSREGRAGSRVIRLSSSLEDTVSIVGSVSTVRDNGSRSGSELLSPEPAAPFAATAEPAPEPSRHVSVTADKRC